MVEIFPSIVEKMRTCCNVSRAYIQGILTKFLLNSFTQQLGREKILKLLGDLNIRPFRAVIEETLYMREYINADIIY